MRNYFEEMNIDYDELKRYEDIETYYDEVQDYSKLIQELQCDRVEVLKQIVNKNKEIERLNNIINELDKWLKYTKEQMEEFQLYKRKETAFWYSTVDNIETFIGRLQELKGE